ncbi:TPA: hypothetical protein QEM96_004387 [Pseudomonas putida]|nr:hypothetical protein [Pseudomonas putida]
MPTENRSSNTEMVSVPRVLTREMLNGVCMHPNLARSLWSALLKNAPQPAEQHQGRPTGLSQGWNLTRQHDGFVIGHSSLEPEYRHKQQALKDGYVYVPFMVEQHQGEPVAWLVNGADHRNAYIQDPKEWAQGYEVLPLYTHADPGKAERLRAVIEQQKNLIASLREELVESHSIDANAEPSAPTWVCQPCKIEQPTDRPCDACGAKTELKVLKS